jgi:hypothetical protein
VKWFLYIWSLYLLVLGCMPCVDLGNDHNQSFHRETTFSSTEAGKSTDHACRDLCSPLCQCACCGCVTISVRAFSFELYVPASTIIPDRTAFTYQALPTSAHLAALFRPPIVQQG